jgi:deoxyadenosine/deoxycytidine kinase
LNFLVLKASSLREAALAGRNVVVDRSLYEDREVMARSWAEKFWDERSLTTYEDCADMLFSGLPVADAVVFCQCSGAECAQRRRTRAGAYQELYDPAWVARLDELYTEWLRRFDAAPLLALDTETYDVRDPTVVGEVVADLQTYFSRPPPDQTVLFGFDGDPPAEPLVEAKERPRLRLLRRLNNVAPRQPVEFGTSSVVGLLGRPVSHPSLYLAAPFTTAAVAPVANVDALLPDDDRAHGVIPAAYRSALEDIAAVLERAGIQVVLPHRDVNAWGTRSLTPERVAQACLELVRGCDGFVGILGESFGAHAEAGMALALGKPCTVVEVAALGHTFIGGGLGHLAGARRVAAETLLDVPAALERTGIETLIR